MVVDGTRVMESAFFAQNDYWDLIGASKTFAHPINFARLDSWLMPTSRVLDLGCGYGRALSELAAHGYRHLQGVDPSPVMVAEARRRVPAATIERLTGFPHTTIPDGTIDAVLLLAVLTAVPGDAEQRALVAEAARVLKPGGLLYISDLWLQDDGRNRERYARGAPGYGYGVFTLPDGGVLRHHTHDWMTALTAGFSTAALDEIQVTTMNGHVAKGFQWFGRTPPA